jgi:hypothetical protein
MDTGPKHGEERAVVGEQKTLLPLDPDEVQVPVLVARRKLAEHELAIAQQIEPLLGATHDDTANLPADISGFTPRPRTRGSIRPAGRCDGDEDR